MAPTVLPILGALSCAFLVGPWTGRDDQQYVVAAWLLGLGIVLWALNWALQPWRQGAQDRLPRPDRAQRLSSARNAATLARVSSGPSTAMHRTPSVDTG